MPPLSKIIKLIISIESEEKNLIKFLKSLRLESSAKILDVGCGFGKKIKLLSTNGFTVVGIEINQNIVNENLKNSLNCMTTSDFEKTNDLYDVVIMSHIIEHFTPNEVLGDDSGAN